MKSMEFTGYLSDSLCATEGVPFDSKANPMEHTVACMKDYGSMASGYGILMKNPKTGKYAFTKFDQKGNEMAKKVLQGTKRTDNMKIKVTGTKIMDMIKVESIHEIE